MSDIKIVMACHKPSELPRNPLYAPIQVGAAVAAKRLDGMLHDDEGENISAKNAQYCELTAQYWAWKNLDSDYIGLCHYRRFLTFAEGDFELDDRNQIQAGFLDDEAMATYGLTDEARMRSIIEANDCVVGALEDVTGLYTPKGEQKTVYDHWAAHDRALINKADLDLLLRLIDEKYPQYSAEAKTYMNGKQFLGYNCFVMKRDLFREMCAYEFDILSELEARIDLSHYSQTLTRVYGFMAEILYSIFIFHQENAGAKVAHLPLVYFNETDPISTYVLQPVEGAIPVVLAAHYKVFGQVLDVTLRSFLNSRNPATAYDVIIFHDELPKGVLAALMRQVEGIDNVSLRFVDCVKLCVGLDARLGYRETGEGERFERLSGDPRAFFPWVLPAYDRVLYFQWNVLFDAPVDELWATDLHGACIGATEGLLEQALVNNPYSAAEGFAREGLKMTDPFDLFDSTVMLMDLAAMRSPQDKEAIARLFREHEFAIGFGNVLNSVYEGRVCRIGFEWDYPLLENAWRKQQLNYAPLDLVNRWKAAATDTIRIRQYDETDPWYPIAADADRDFWRLAREGELYELMISAISDQRFKVQEEETNRRITTIAFTSLFPKNTKRRSRIERACPPDTLRRRIIDYMS